MEVIEVRDDCLVVPGRYPWVPPEDLVLRVESHSEDEAPRYRHVRYHEVQGRVTRDEVDGRSRDEIRSLITTRIAEALGEERA